MERTVSIASEPPDSNQTGHDHLDSVVVKVENPNFDILRKCQTIKDEPSDNFCDDIQTEDNSQIRIENVMTTSYGEFASLEQHLMVMDSSRDSPHIPRADSSKVLYLEIGERIMYV